MSKFLLDPKWRLAFNSTNVTSFGVDACSSKEPSGPGKPLEKPFEDLFLCPIDIKPSFEPSFIRATFKSAETFSPVNSILLKILRILISIGWLLGKSVNFAKISWRISAKGY